MIDAELIVSGGAVLGEGPVWDVSAAMLYWLDIKGRRVHAIDPATGARKGWTVPFRITSLAPRQRGGFVAGSDRGIIGITDDFASFEPLCNPEAEVPSNRFNDGKVDRAGRFWAGTMDDDEQRASGSLYRLGSNGGCDLIESDYLVTNGPAFSISGDVMYHADSARQVIYRFDLSDSGGVLAKRPFVQFKDGDGFPDGMTVDAEDCLWVAFWDGWCLRRFNHAGEVIATVPMPVARPTSVAFGGAALDELFVTSATHGLTPEALARQPAAGGLFRLRPGVTGVAALPYRG